MSNFNKIGQYSNFFSTVLRVSLQGEDYTGCNARAGLKEVDTVGIQSIIVSAVCCMLYVVVKSELHCKILVSFITVT